MKKSLVLSVIAGAMILAMVPVTFFVILPAVKSLRPEPAPDPTSTVVETPSTAPTSSPAPTSTPTPSSESALKRVAITAEDIQLFGDDGALVTKFTYFSETAGAVAALTGQFGADPVVENILGKGGHNFPAVSYTWGGFRLWDSERQIVDIWVGEFQVSTSSASFNEIPIQTMEGLSVGDAATNVAARYPDSEVLHNPDGAGPQRFHIGVINHGFDPGWGGGATLRVAMVTDDLGGAIEMIYAPDSDYGP